ncbi:MAG: hypothetical protein WAP37_03465 [Solirubrobacterales bacterium]
MGKRSRKQLRTRHPGPGESAAGRRRGGSPAKRVQLRERAAKASESAERSIKRRPPAPWDPYPLTELAILLGLIGLITGALIGGATGTGIMASGAVLAGLGGLETVAREHFNGYRPHAGLLAGALALVALVVSSTIAETVIAARAAIAIGVFAVTFPVLRRAYIQRSGGSGVL